jgi:hypothetical protein
VPGTASRTRRPARPGIIAGMTHAGWGVQLTAYAARDWRANFFPVGITHSMAWEPTPWRAVQRAAWEAVTSWYAA